MSFHPQTKSMSTQLKTCDELGIIRSTLALSHRRSKSNQLTWHKLLSLLIEEYNRPSGIKNQIALELAYFIILSMIKIDPKTYKSSILLLPYILMEMNDLDLGCKFLTMIEMRMVSKVSYKRLMSVKKHLSIGKHYIDKPIQKYCSKKCDPFLLLDMVYLKMQYKFRLDSLWEFQAIYGYDHRIKSALIMDNIATYVGVTKDWKRMNSMVIERQALDLVKLIYLIDDLLLRTFIRSVEQQTNNHIFRHMPLNVRLAQTKWRVDAHTTNFLKQAVADCKR